ncbi:hypothetical protein IV203_031875 [Nitzschia inconspicua]|uniref:Uncharacterized protein n=1 Tax=Nitzschia inconspicua TaxID=303405 RepID=A0A9K3Q2S1_9STRA|nr:hypothetical protein IV203_031875 [Nitzschia inconspicua]
MMTEIHTAVPLDRSSRQHDLEQPLLPSSTPQGQDEEEKIHSCWFTSFIASWTFINGFWLGFLIQTISLGSTAVLAINWGKPATWTSKQDEFYYAVFFLLSQSWWLLFPIICFAIDGGLAANGKSLFERCFYPNASVAPREVFLGGVRFHVGIVFGCFFVWSLIDLYFGASVTVFITLFFSFMACLGLCYGMVLIYERYIVEQEREQSATSSK